MRALRASSWLFLCALTSCSPSLERAERARVRMDRSHGNAVYFVKQLDLLIPIACRFGSRLVQGPACVAGLGPGDTVLLDSGDTAPILEAAEFPCLASDQITIAFRTTGRSLAEVAVWPPDERTRFVGDRVRDVTQADRARIIRVTGALPQAHDGRDLLGTLDLDTRDGDRLIFGMGTIFRLGQGELVQTRWHEFGGIVAPLVLLDDTPPRLLLRNDYGHGHEYAIASICGESLDIAARWGCGS
jgi:hypothetical protein